MRFGLVGVGFILALLFVLGGFRLDNMLKMGGFLLLPLALFIALVALWAVRRPVLKVMGTGLKLIVGLYVWPYDRIRLLPKGWRRLVRVVLILTGVGALYLLSAWPLSALRRQVAAKAAPVLPMP
jgi:hypothetical protein